MGFIRFHWVLLGFIEFYWVLLASTGFYCVKDETSAKYFAGNAFHFPRKGGADWGRRHRRLADGDVSRTGSGQSTLEKRVRAAAVGLQVRRSHFYADGGGCTRPPYKKPVNRWNEPVSPRGLRPTTSPFLRPSPTPQKSPRVPRSTSATNLVSAPPPRSRWHFHQRNSQSSGTSFL